MTSQSPNLVADNDPTRIRDAACVVVVDDTSCVPLLLMGRRRADQIFLPGKWVFPGGRVDPNDTISTPRAGDDIDGFTSSLPGYLKPFARAAVRELQEEAGLSLCTQMTNSDEPSSQFLPLARAITPPGRVRRYDTWFFLTQRSAFRAELGSTDDELLDLGWFTISDARHLDIPNITRLVLDDATAWIASGARVMPRQIPFYYQDGQGFQRIMMACDQSALPP